MTSCQSPFLLHDSDEGRRRPIDWLHAESGNARPNAELRPCTTILVRPHLPAIVGHGLLLLLIPASYGNRDIPESSPRSKDQSDLVPNNQIEANVPLFKHDLT